MLYRAETYAHVIKYLGGYRTGYRKYNCIKGASLSALELILMLRGKEALSKLLFARQSDSLIYIEQGNEQFTTPKKGSRPETFLWKNNEMGQKHFCKYEDTLLLSEYHPNLKSQHM